MARKYFTTVDSVDFNATREHAKQFGCSCRLIQEHGPAGGNAEVAVFGTRLSVERFLASEDYDLDAHEIRVAC